MGGALSILASPAAWGTGQGGATGRLDANGRTGADPNENGGCVMGLFRRWSRNRRSTSAADSPSRSDRRATIDALAEWASARRGVEAYVEPKTSVTENSILLVAHDGEFTRRRVPSPQAARDFARSNGMPIYDATVVGYPQRMRDFSRRQRISERGRRFE